MSRVWILGFCVVALLAVPASAAVPDLQAGVRIQAGGSPLTVDLMAAPEVVDWNNDGKKDLVVGQFTNGKIRLYLNTGTDASPTFGAFSYIRSGGTDIQVGGS